MIEYQLHVVFQHCLNEPDVMSLHKIRITRISSDLTFATNAIVMLHCCCGGIYRVGAVEVVTGGGV